MVDPGYGFAVLVEIRGIDLPGRRFEGFEDVRVGMRVGDDVVGLVAGDAAGAHWETEVRVRELSGGFDSAVRRSGESAASERLRWGGWTARANCFVRRRFGST
jgi:hypothetical protein